jgi:hypothetical protein
VVQLSPLAYLVIDRSDCDIPQMLRFHVPSGADLEKLQLLPLCGLAPAQCPAKDYPTQTGDAYVTEEIQFAVTDPSCSVLLLQVDVNDNTTLTTGQGGNISLQHKDFAVELHSLPQGSFIISDLKNSRRQEIPLNGTG